MKNNIICIYETIPSQGEVKQYFPSFLACKNYIWTELISKINPTYFINKMKGLNTRYCKKAAEVLSGFFCSFDYKVTDTIMEDTDCCLIIISPDEIHVNLNDEFIFTYNFINKIVDEGVLRLVCNNESNLPKNSIKEVFLKVTETKKWGNSAYPIMVLRALEKVPKSQAQIIAFIESEYSVTIGRKAVGNHIQLLNDLGFEIQHNKKGYYVIK